MAKPHDLSVAQQRVLDRIDGAEVVDELVKMVRVPSVTGADAESALQHDHADGMRALGVEVDLW